MINRINQTTKRIGDFLGVVAMGTLLILFTWWFLFQGGAILCLTVAGWLLYVVLLWTFEHIEGILWTGIVFIVGYGCGGVYGTKK